MHSNAVKKHDTTIPQAFADPSQPPRVAVACGIEQGAFAQRFLDGVRCMADDLGMMLDIPDQAASSETLADQVRDAIASGAQAVIVSHGTGDPLQAAMHEALEQGIPVIGVDTAVGTPGAVEIEQDDMLIGLTLARRLVEAMGDQAQVLYLSADASTPMQRRDRAWEASLHRYPGLRQVGRTGHMGPGGLERTVSEVEALLGDIDGPVAVVAMWDEFAKAAFTAARNLGREDDIRIFGVDIADSDIGLMSEPGSPWVTTVCTDPRTVGRLALRAAACRIAGDGVDKYLYVEPACITRRFLLDNRVGCMDDLLQLMPTLAESPRCWAPWMAQIIVQNGTEPQASTRSREELLLELQTTLVTLRRRNAELTMAAEVAREATAATRLKDLLDLATRLLCERFGFYHSSIFLANRNHCIATLRAAAGEGADAVMAEGLSLDIGTGSIVGHVLEMGKHHLALDTTRDPLHYASQHLPDTRSELVLPLRAGTETIGVLDVQSERPHAFGQEEVRSMQGLADQLAVAIEKLRLFERSQSALEQRLGTVISNAPIMVFGFDRQGVITLAEGRGLEALGQAAGVDEPHPLVGRSAAEAFPGLPHADEMVEDVLSGLSFKNTLELAGNVFEARWTPLRDSVGAISGFTVVATDVTSRKHAEDALRLSEANHRAMFENAIVGIFQATPEGRYISANPAMARILGYASPQDLMQSVSDMGSEVCVDQRAHAKLLQTLRRYGAITGKEMVCRRKSGEEIVLATHCRGVYDEHGGLVLMEGMLQDVTERHKAQEELADMNRRLEQLVAERTRDLDAKANELEKANLRLRELDELKSAFLSTVSHDLRTPLTSVLGFAKLIDRDFHKSFSPLARLHPELERSSKRISGNLDIIQDEGNRLTRLINDFLDLSRIESGRMSWDDKECRFEDMVERAIKAVSGRFSQRPDVHLAVALASDLPELFVDPDRIVQVLVNLMDNALKFTERGTVSVSASESGPERLQVRIQDTGHGIPDSELDMIFDKFYQVSTDDTLEQKPQGTGMGLAICRHIVEHYGGSIRAEACRQGAAFVFDLPTGRARFLDP